MADKERTWCWLWGEGESGCCIIMIAGILFFVGAIVGVKIIM